MEALAQNPAAQLPKTKEEADTIKALWILTAPGTYFEAYKKGELRDRYSDQPWSYWMDRRRINYAFQVGRYITELRFPEHLSGQKLGNNWFEAKELIKEYGPLIVYNGRSDESLAMAKAVETPWLRIPQGLEYPAERTHIIHPIGGFDPTANLRYNIETFRLPPPDFL